MSRPVSAALAITHEALYPRLEALLRQVEAIAARRPGAPVPAATRAAAEALLFDAQRFAPQRKAGLPAAADTYGPLATALGQALARLSAFETAHSAWSAPHAGFVWRLPRHALRPVERLRPKSAPPPDPAADRESAHIRAELIRRIDAKYDEGFDAGLKAASSRQPDTLPLSRPRERVARSAG